VHLTGLLLRRLVGTPWVADFRDPWTDINYYHELPHTAPARWADAQLERLVLKRADVVTTVSPTWSALLAGKANGQTPVHVVHNGFDAEDFDENGPSVSSDHFELTYVGSLYASRNPEMLWRVLGRLRERGALPKLRLRLVGAIEPVVQEALTEHGLDSITEVVSYVPHAEAVEHMQRAGLLLLIIEAFEADRGMITGKLYEYLAAGRPVLGIGPSDGDAAHLLDVTGGGRMFSRSEDEALEAYLLDQYAAWEEGQPRAGIERTTVAPYSRRAQTGELAKVLSRTTT
jgi:glycosyltransferase involved in cell wall biosynthesis